MIRKVRGNLLEADAEALVNTVNTVGVMGRGVALQFKRAFPENFKAYKKVCDENKLKTGEVFTYDLHSFQNPRYIINFPTKKHWKGKSKLEYIETGLVALAKEIDRLDIESIALPPLGCGLGGLEWNEVYQRIEEALARLESVKVLVYEPTGAPAATQMQTRTDRPRMTPGRAALLGLMKRYLAPLMDDSVTLLEIHKLMYFMQEAGERLKLDYVKGVYGPYAMNLHHVLERIEGHFIVGYGEGSEEPGKVIEYRPKAAEQAEQFLKDHGETLARFRRIESLIEGFETPYGMELLASVHWIVCHEDDRVHDGADVVVGGVHAWNDRKARVFRAEHIRIAWERLGEQEWLARHP